MKLVLLEIAEGYYRRCKKALKKFEQLANLEDSDLQEKKDPLESVSSSVRFSSVINMTTSFPLLTQAGAGSFDSCADMRLTRNNER